MIRRIRQYLAAFIVKPRRRASTHLTARYEARRIRELRRARAIFQGEAL